MHLLFVLFTFSLIFEIVIASCVVLFCNSPFLCSFEHDLRERDITFLCLIGGGKPSGRTEKFKRTLFE